MNVKKPRAIRAAALESLATQPDHRKVALVYAGISAALSLAVTIIRDILSLQISQMTGLSNMGTRAVLSTIGSTLPVIQMLFLFIWTLCYQKCALGFARRRTTDPWSLKEGFLLFGPMLRAKFFMALVYGVLAMACLYLSLFIFMALPISQAFYEIMMPLMESVNVMNPTIVIDEATLAAATAAMWPAFVIFGAVFLLASLPVFYGFRMVNYCICDNGHRGALAAIKASRTMMKGHKWHLFKLDFSFWWFFLLECLVTLLCYLDFLLPMAGINLPISGTVSYYGFYILSLGLQVVLYWAFLNRVTVSRAAFYDAIRPQEAAPRGVALGNIFELAKDYEE